jgi:uncharacterized damage-inducible protein DinB
VRLDDLRFLVAYDRWATRRVLDALAGVDAATWAASGAVGDRGLGGILVHQLGAAQRWRNGLAETGAVPRPEREPLPSVDALRAAWEAEWQAWDSWLATLDDEGLDRPLDGVPMWRLLAHVMNHGTQHRSEAAVLLTDAGRSPGDLDMVFFAEELAAGGSAG